MAFSALAIRRMISVTRRFKSVMRPRLTNAIRFEPTTERIFTWYDRNKLNTRIRSVVETQLRRDADGYNILSIVRSDGTDRFGLTSTDRLIRARTRFLSQIRQATDRAVIRKRAVGEVVQEVQEIIDKQSPFKALIAYETARTENLKTIAELLTDGEKRITIKLSPAHRETDICNDLVGTFPISKIDLPPFHPYCRCYVVRSS